MTLSYVTLFGANFIIMTVFFGLITYCYYAKHRDMKVSLRLQFKKEEERLGALTNELSKIADTLTQKLEKKEKAIRILLEKVQFYETSLQTQVGAVEKRVAGAPVTTSHERPMSVVAPEDEKYKDIYYCADNGMRIADIARKTGKIKGEIELILSLRNAQAATL